MNKPLSPRQVASVIDGARTRPFRPMPDVANEVAPELSGALARVGMSHVELPLHLQSSEGQPQTVVAKADAWVDLVDPAAKGIHMSRLYLALDQHLTTAPLSVDAVRETLSHFLGEHSGLSSEAHLTLRFERLRRRGALVSAHQGWRSYPVEVDATWDGEALKVALSVAVQYSSTCPCSAALARQLIQERFDADFNGAESLRPEDVRAWLGTPEAICATPHSQRSEASVRVHLRDNPSDLAFDQLIDQVEDCLKTVVQAAVKREDEQAFALLNGRNLMFCEDAARRVKRLLETRDDVVDYRLECRHAESLHPHDAVAIAVKGVAGGLTA